MSADELHHTFKQIAQQQLDTRKPFAFAHIATYDPKTGMVKVVYPSLRNEDGTPTMSPWIQLSTGWAGPSGQSFGMQYHPIGGASLENPTAGEQVLVSVIDNVYGSAMASVVSFNSSALPPMADLLPGELVIQGGQGSYARWHQNGDFEVNTQNNTTGNTIVNATNVTVNATGAINLFAPLVKLAASMSATVQALCTAAFETWAATHTHPGTSGPSTPPPSNSLTTVVMGE